MSTRRTFVRVGHIVLIIATFVLIALTLIHSYQAKAQSTTPNGHPLPANCQVNVGLNDRGDVPVDAVRAVANNGGAITVERNAPWLYQVTVTRWTLNEDAEEWGPDGTITDYEVECHDDPPATNPDNEVNIPLVVIPPKAVPPDVEQLYDPYQKHVMLVVASIFNTADGRAANVSWLDSLTPEQRDAVYQVDDAIIGLCEVFDVPADANSGCGK